MCLLEEDLSFFLSFFTSFLSDSFFSATILATKLCLGGEGDLAQTGLHCACSLSFLRYSKKAESSEIPGGALGRADLSPYLGLSRLGPRAGLLLRPSWRLLCSRRRSRSLLLGLQLRLRLLLTLTLLLLLTGLRLGLRLALGLLALLPLRIGLRLPRLGLRLLLRLRLRPESRSLRFRCPFRRSSSIPSTSSSSSSPFTHPSSYLTALAVVEEQSTVHHRIQDLISCECLSYLLLALSLLV